MNDFRDKVIVVTGAAGGMGRAYAEYFAALGATLALNDIDGAELEQTAARARSAGAKTVITDVFDVSSRDAMFAFASRVHAELGGAHVVINNAGIEGETAPVTDLSDAGLNRLMGVNFWGVVHGTRAFLPQIQARGQGAVVNVSSVFGFVGTPNAADYCASKFAVRGFTESLMVELRQSPISVHLVHPGGIATGIARGPRAQAFARKYLRTPPEVVARAVAKAIADRTLRVVVGHNAWRTWFAGNLLPLGLRNWFLERELRDVL